MSGPYKAVHSEPWGRIWNVVGPTPDSFVYLTEGSATDAARRANAAYAAALEQAAKVAEKFYGGPAHTYASENADRYRAQDEACRDIASAIRALIAPTAAGDGE